MGGGVVDVDECTDVTKCSVNAVRCINTPGSYTCLCKDGYQFKTPDCVGP